MTRKNDLTALLPFPICPMQAMAPTDRGVTAEPSANTGSNPRSRSVRAPAAAAAAIGGGSGREPVRLDQLDLAALVRHHATRRAALRGTRRTAEGTGEDAAARSREALRKLPRNSRWSESENTRRICEVTVERDTGDTGGAVVGPAGDLCVGAVRRQSVNFYLDLVGAVTVMALVLLAAILA